MKETLWTNTYLKAIGLKMSSSEAAKLADEAVFEYEDRFGETKKQNENTKL